MVPERPTAQDLRGGPGVRGHRRPRAAFRIAPLAVALLAACAEPATRADLTLTLPAGDFEAASSLALLEIAVWPAESGACAELRVWRRAVCGQACTAPVAPAGEPLSATRIQRSEGVALDLPKGGPWDVVVHGLDGDGTAFLHGCATLTEEGVSELPLWRPWCDAKACLFHPACHAEVDCEASDGDGRPVCKLHSPTLTLWLPEQDGVACDSFPEAPRGACRLERVDCVEGQTEPVTRGVCPVEPTCDETDPGTDRDCNGVPDRVQLRCPGACEGDACTCDPGEAEACRQSPECLGARVCQDDGTWGACLFDWSWERCNGLDDDCNGVPDSEDPYALLACNWGRSSSMPSASACTDAGECVCGDGPACEGWSTCCGGGCVDLWSDVLNCGRCGRKCDPGQRCDRGDCRGSSTG